MAIDLNLFSVYDIDNGLVCWLVAEDMQGAFEVAVKELCLESAHYEIVWKRHLWSDVFGTRNGKEVQYSICWDGYAEIGRCYYP